MSCSVCRMGFVPGPSATSPFPEHFPPQGLMSTSLYNYFTGAIGVGFPDIQGLKSNYNYVSCNMFTGFNGIMVLCVLWETDDGGTAFMMHTGCANLFLHRMQADTDTFERFTLLSEIVGVLGRPLHGKDAGRLTDVRYEDVGEKIDLKPFWTTGNELGANVFNWRALSQSPYAFLLNKPNVFPRFYTEVAPDRTALLENINFSNTDAFTSLPLDILETLIPHLTMQSYVMLTSTCRFLRLHALTTFQPHARRFVLQLPWSLPVSTELKEMKPQTLAKLPSRDQSARDADWYLYLSHIHRTDSMRVRKWIWSLVDEMHHQYVKKRDTSPATDPTTDQYKLIHSRLKKAFELSQMSARMKKTK